MDKQEVKQVYDVADIQNILGLGRSKTYGFLEEVYKNKTPFNVIKIGKLYKVPKISFDNWINNGMCDIENN
ncbi:MAG: helix-turn-helix domain-containing protein [Bacilli bacterium]|nr:helix-turn-helix domain-containing protein [Bacilli bacterium]